MEIQVSDIVCSLAGRDKDKLCFVLGLDEGYALLADGKGRRIEKPKRKKLRHVKYVASQSSRTVLKLRSGDKVSNSELRRALADFAAHSAESKEVCNSGER